MKCKHKDVDWEKSLQTLHLIKDLYTEYIKLLQA